MRRCGKAERAVRMSSSPLITGMVRSVSSRSTGVPARRRSRACETVLDRHDPIAEHAQGLLDGEAHLGLVLGEQDDLAVTARRLHLGGLEAVHRAPVLGQEDVNGRAVAPGALGDHPAVVLLDQTVDLGEAEPGAMAVGLGGEERLEDVGQMLGADAAPGVDESQVNPGSREHPGAPAGAPRRRAPGAARA